MFHAPSFERSLRTQLLAGGSGPLVPMAADAAREMADEFDRTCDARVMTTWAYLLRAARLAARHATG